MRYTLKDYQDDAVNDMLDRLQQAAHNWRQFGTPAAISLTATTGAGKTVMAAAVIEALFDGDAERDFEPDPGAVVLWFTDDPSLNEQTRFRLLDAGDKLSHSRLTVIDSSFNQEKLESGMVYFLNAQKLSKKSLLVRGAPEPDEDDPRQELANLPPPDRRAWTMWDTLRNTIEDENLTLYLILDEAHRGMKRRTSDDRKEKATIVQRLINGGNGVPAVPIVWGISATVQRFDAAMKAAQGRTVYPPVVVDPARVQASGLIKDDIRLDFPREPGQFDTVLLARAVRKVRAATEHWRDYAERENIKQAVAPLLVVQVPNKPSDKLLLSAFDTIAEHWPDLEQDAMAHVFGEHKDIEVGGYTVPHISPERVQESTHVRVLFAKDAISTGWDCPRAEVLVSFRPAKDETHITQLLGRMVRTPLARRIPGNDVLNSIECLLPHFDRDTATHVSSVLLGAEGSGADGSGDTGGGDGRRVLFKPVDMEVNPAIPESVWEAFDKLPSQTLPRKTARPVRQLTALAYELSKDGLRKNAIKEAYGEMVKVLEGLATRYKDKVEAARHDLLHMEGETLIGRIVGDSVTSGGTFTELADDRAVQAEYRRAGRVLTPELARRYADHIAVEDEDDDGLFDAHVGVAALARVEGVSEDLDREADKLAGEWFAKYRRKILNLPDERQSAYKEIRGMSREPLEINIQRPRTRSEETEDKDGNKVETREHHLMSDENGEFPIGSLNDWERGVLDSEMSEPSFRAWYRNPSRPSDDALAIAYKDGQGNWRRMCPDFLFFTGEDDDIKVCIVDPHGHHLGDAMPKLRGLAKFAEEYGGRLHRIESVARMEDGTLRVLDLMDAKVRDEIDGARDAKKLYQSKTASDYR